MEQKVVVYTHIVLVVRVYFRISKSFIFTLYLMTFLVFEKSLANTNLLKAQIYWHIKTSKLDEIHIITVFN